MLCSHCGGYLTTTFKEYTRRFSSGGLIYTRVPFLSCAQCGLSDQLMDVGPIMDSLAGILADLVKAVENGS